STTKILYEADSLFAPAGSGLPHTGQILSQTNPSVSFQLQPYNANNDLLFTDTTTAKTLTLTTPLSFTSLNVLDTSAGGSTYNMTLNFTDGSSHQIGTGVSVPDRLLSTGSATGFLGDMDRSNTASNYTLRSGNLFEQDFSLPAADQAKLIKSVSFQQASGSRLNVFALSGVSLPAAVTGFANAVNVTANSTINVPTIATSLGAVSVKAGATL